jgi:hypothetical protein
MRFRPLRPGDRSEIVAQFKRRYGVVPSDDLYSQDLVPFIRAAQKRLNLSVTGLITDDLVDMLLVSNK